MSLEIRKYRDTSVESVMQELIQAKAMNQQVVANCEFPTTIVTGLGTDRMKHIHTTDYPIVNGHRPGGVTIHSPGQSVILFMYDYASRHVRYTRAIREIVVTAAEIIRDIGQPVELKGEPTYGLYTPQGLKLANYSFNEYQGWLTWGIAVNVNNDLDLYKKIKQCGVDVTATSLQSEGWTINFETFADDLTNEIYKSLEVL